MELWQNVKNGLYSDYFPSKVEEIFYLILRQLEELDEPAGAWMLREKLFDYGVNCSTATIGRYLRELDYKGYTVQCSNQGRILTQEGREYLAELDSNLERAQLQGAVSEAMQIQDYGALIDLLNARIAIEKETSALAASNATKKEYQELLNVLEENRICVSEGHDPTDVALKFHLTIARISHNHFMLALLDMLIFEEYQIEDRFETIISCKRGPRYLIDHEAITKAIVDGDAVLASHLMGKHLNVIVESYRQEKNKTAQPDK